MEGKKITTFIDRMYALDRRIIFVFIFLGVLIPFLVDFPLPIKPTQSVRNIHDTIEELAARPNGGTILMSFDFDPSSAAEMEPMTRAVVAHVFSHKGKVKLVGMGHWQTGTALAERILSTLAREFDVEYGKDWAFLGFKSGGPALVITMGQDFHAAFSTDAKGNDTKTMPVTRNITKLGDFDYMLDWSAGSMGIDTWVIFGQTRYKFKMGGGCTAVMGPDFFPYLQTGQLNGLIAGLVGAAEYEALVGRPANAIEGMKPQSVVHVILILFILFSNFIYYMKKNQDKRGNV